MATLIIFIVSAVVLILLGMNIGVTFLVISLVFEFVTGGDIGGFARIAFSANNSYSLLAIPLFMLGGLLMERSGIAGALVDFCEAFLGKVKGGMGHLIPLVSMIFGSMCGSGMATVATIGSIVIPRLERLGWDRRYTTALVGASCPLGYMIPPNMNAIIYSTVTTASVSCLFLATVIPGIMWAIGYMIVNRIVYAKWYDPARVGQNEALMGADVKAESQRILSKWQVTKAAIPAFIMPVIILGGIYGGIFTPTEAGAVSGLYALIVGLFVYRKLKGKEALKCFSDTGMQLGTLMVILPFAMIFAKILIVEGIPELVTDILTGITDNRAMLLLIIVIMMLICGMFFEAPILTMVLPPILMPTLTALGMGPNQFGVIAFMAVGIGGMTPPMAVPLFVACRIGKVSVAEVLKPLLPFIFFVSIPIMLLVTYIPPLTMWLPSVALGIPFA